VSYAGVDEQAVEEMALDQFQALGYDVLYGPEIAPGGVRPERRSYEEVLLVQRFATALRRLNPSLPEEALQEAVNRVIYPDHPDLGTNNHQFHRFVMNGVDVEYRDDEGQTRGVRVRLFDFENPDANDWAVVNQFRVIEGDYRRRCDIVVFANGLPLAVVELKDPEDTQATLRTAYDQLQTYLREIPSLFHCNEVLVISDGFKARHGTITAGWERFVPWRTVDGSDLAPTDSPQLGVLIQGIFEKKRFLDIIRNFISCERNGRLVKKMATYHQYHAVNVAIEETIRASRADGDRRIGVVWHTQGSGKSLSMTFYTGKIIRHPAMENPTVVVITDRNDLDNQLFDKFAAAADLIPFPTQAESREHLKDLLRVTAGGIIFTTAQKFFPEPGTREYPLLSDRRNIIVIADEAHRSQYNFIEGFARYMRDALPRASFIGFTGTPIEETDRSTRQVFGDYISIYDLEQSVEDGMTVPIYYESRLAKLDLSEAERPHIDPEFEEVTEGVEEPTRAQLRRRWSRLEAVVGAERRLALIAQDILQHWEQRSAAIEGKAMIVGMSRQVCVDLYRHIIELQPDWHHEDDGEGVIKLVMTGSASDPATFQPHIRTKAQEEAIKQRFLDPEDPLTFIIVCDMWLTGFDAPLLHTMYIDKPLHGHTLMQAIARVNRPYKDKQGGLIVDYIGIAPALKEALSEYTEGSREKTGVPIEQAVQVMLEKFDVVRSMFRGLDYSDYFGDDRERALAAVLRGADHVSEPKLKGRFLKAATDLSRAFSLAVPHEEARAIRDHVGYFQAVKSNLVKYTGGGKRSTEDVDSAIRQLVSRAVAADEVIDILDAAGLQRPDISILSDEFLEDVKKSEHRNLQLEMLKKLINDELQVRAKRNMVEASSFRERLETTINRYHNRTIDSVQVLEELIQMAKELRDSPKRGAELGLTEEEVAFYDALATNESAVELMGDDTLKKIARDLVQVIRRNTTIDWNLKESVRAKLRAAVKRLLTRYGYPPDEAEESTEVVFKQVSLWADDWVNGN